jgi:hypothetical protein
MAKTFIFVHFQFEVKSSTSKGDMSRNYQFLVAGAPKVGKSAFTVSKSVRGANEI